MKKTIIKVLALTLVMVMGCVMFTSCGAPIGEYGDDDVTIKFTLDKKVTVTWSDFTLEGEFEMGEDDEGDKTIDLDLEEPSSFEAKIVWSLLNGEHSYNEGEDNDGKYIEIGKSKYYKK